MVCNNTSQWGFWESHCDLENNEEIQCIKKVKVANDVLKFPFSHAA